MSGNIIFFGIVFFSVLVSADYCAPNITLLNQDPYPAIPGEYVKIVFQISSISSSDCSDIFVDLIEKYPLVFDPGEDGSRVFKKVDYVKDFGSSILVPYKVRVDSGAVDGANQIEVKLQSKGGRGILLNNFELEIQDLSVDFEIFVYDYDSQNSEVTFQILNVGSSNIEALVVEIPKQENILVKGANRKVVGDLDSKEYTTTNFEAQLQDGEILLNLFYTDEINKRRSDFVKLEFDSFYFENKFSDNEKTSVWFYVVVLLIVVLLVYFILKKRKRKKDKFDDE